MAEMNFGEHTQINHGNKLNDLQFAKNNKKKKSKHHFASTDKPGEKSTWRYLKRFVIASRLFGV